MSFKTIKLKDHETKGLEWLTKFKTLHTGGSHIDLSMILLHLSHDWRCSKLSIRNSMWDIHTKQPLLNKDTLESYVLFARMSCFNVELQPRHSPRLWVKIRRSMKRAWIKHYNKAINVITRQIRDSVSVVVQFWAYNFWVQTVVLGRLSFPFGLKLLGGLRLRTV